MTRYLLDTNIISNVTKPRPSETLIAWMEDRADEDLFIASLTLAEIRRGVLEKPAGKKRARLESWFSGPEGPQALFAGHVLAFDEKAALIWARLMAEGTARGRKRSALEDCLPVTPCRLRRSRCSSVHPFQRPRPPCTLSGRTAISTRAAKREVRGAAP